MLNLALSAVNNALGMLAPVAQISLRGRKILLKIASISVRAAGDGSLRP
jgi:hypothetical protein